MDWRPYPPDTRYSVSADGLVMSQIRSTIMSPCESPNGYLKVRIGGRSGKNLFIHRMVAETFLEKKSGLNTVNHKNGIKTDNRLENLEWVSYSENVKHAVKMGLKKIQSGKDSGRYRITPSIVGMVKFMRSENHNYDQIVAICGISKKSISTIVKGRYVNKEISEAYD